MPDDLYVNVPADLAWELDEDGIEEIGRVRGPEWLPQSAAVAVTVAGAAANVTTVLLAKDSIARFIRRFAEWATRRSESAQGSTLTVSFESRHGDQDANEELTVKISARGTLSDADSARLTSLLEAAFAYNSELSEGHASAPDPLKERY